MFPAPGRPPTRHRSGCAARNAVGFSRRGGFFVSVLHHTAISPVGSPHSVGHYMQDSARRAAHTSHICVVFAPLPARPRSKGSVLRGLHSGTRDWIIEVPLASPAATCSNLDALEVRLDMLMSSAALRAPGVPPTWLHLSLSAGHRLTLGVSGRNAWRPGPVHFGHAALR